MSGPGNPINGEGREVLNSVGYNDYIIYINQAIAQLGVWYRSFILKMSWKRKVHNKTDLWVECHAVPITRIFVKQVPDQ